MFLSPAAHLPPYTGRQWVRATQSRQLDLWEQRGGPYVQTENRYLPSCSSQVPAFFIIFCAFSIFLFYFLATQHSMWDPSSPINDQTCTSCGGSKSLQYSFFLIHLLIWPHQVSVAACGNQFPDQWSNLGSLHWEHGVLATGSPGKSPFSIFDNLFLASPQSFVETVWDI